MKNYLHKGEIIDFIAPTGGVVSGQGYVIGSFFTIATITAADGDVFPGAVEGVFELPAATHASAQLIAAGGPVYWDATNKLATATASGNTPIGASPRGKASLTATVVLKLIQRPPA